MKRSAKIVIASAVVIGAAVAALGGYNYIKTRTVPVVEGMTITAHTGCEGTEDNSLEAITKGYESGADIVEFDLMFTASGEAVLAHDEPEQSSVTLDEAFAHIAKLEGFQVNVDCKSTDNLKAVTELAAKHGISDRIFYTGINEEDVQAVKQQTPEVLYWLNYDVEISKNKNEEYLLSLVEKVKELGAEGLNISHKKCSKKLIEVFHREGLKVSIWTVNNEFSMVRALELGADNITTRQTAQLKEIIELKTAK